MNADLDDDGTGFEAAHIFPLAFEGLFKQFNYDRWIKSPSDGGHVKGGKINSVQNGLLLNSAVDRLFDTCMLSINPDVSVQSWYSG